MADANGRIHIMTEIYGGPQDTDERFITGSNTASLKEVRSLAGGDNTITDPTAGATAVEIIPPGSGTQKLKGNAGDTGVTIDNTRPTIIKAGTFILNVTGTPKVTFIWIG